MRAEINQFNYKNYINKKLGIKKRSDAYSRVRSCRIEEVLDRPFVIDVWTSHPIYGDSTESYLGRFDIFTFLNQYEIKVNEFFL